MIKTNKALIEKYKEKQLYVAIEELSELQKEICKALRGNANQDNICEEMADVYIILGQLMLYFNINLFDIEKMIKYKINRTEERLLKKEV